MFHLSINDASVARSDIVGLMGDVDSVTSKEVVDSASILIVVEFGMVQVSFPF
jgi:hypothetical protein